MQRMTVRIPGDLETALKDEAKKECRSVNGQLVYVLRQHYEELWPRYSSPKPVEEATEGGEVG